MEESLTNRKRRKGFGRLWSKIKLAIRPRSKTKTTSKTAQTYNPQILSSPLPPSMGQRFTPARSASAVLPAVDQTTPVPSLPVTSSSVAPAMSHQQRIEPESDTESAQQPTVPDSTRAVPEVIGSADDKEVLARRYERAQTMFRKYSLEFDEESWSVRSDKAQPERVYKNPRIRVRWTCHECRTTFGHDRVCVECAHQRCRACTRYPVKRRKSRAARKATVSTAWSESLEHLCDGICHECQTPFEDGLRDCSNCNHTICERCLQETLSTEQTVVPTTTAA